MDTQAPNGADTQTRTVIRFAGDSGDGIQLSGTRLTMSVALGGHGLSTLPDFPAEIRAPTGTTYGVSAFQLHVGNEEVRTSGDDPNVLVAMNPAALATNLSALTRGGLLIIDSGTFSEKSIRRAGLKSNPLEDGSLEDYRLVAPDISRHVLDTVKPFELGQKTSLRCRNMWVLGLLQWLLGRDTAETEKWIRGNFKDASLSKANIAALKAGHAFGETAEIPEIDLGAAGGKSIGEAGEYRTVTGAQAMAFGIAAAAELSGLDAVFCAYPITPASSLLHHLAGMHRNDIITFQAEDEMAAACAAIGASYGGELGITSSAGPGISLKAESLGFAVMAEIPLLVINVQRAGPSTGMPTKTEQADLLQAMHGRHGEAPLAVLAPRSPVDCFDTAIEAARIAIRHMTPVMILSDALVTNASEPWHIPRMNSLAPFPAKFRTDPEGFEPYKRNPETLARDWVKPGTPGLEHRIGGLEKSDGVGNISYDPENHQKMNETRIAKVANIVHDIPAAEPEGPDSGPLCVVGWGSSYGAISEATESARKEGFEVAHLHLRHLHPLPSGLADVLSRFDQVLVPENNAGQLVRIIRDVCLVPAEGFSRMRGHPFRVDELVDAIRERAIT